MQFIKFFCLFLIFSIGVVVTQYEGGNQDKCNFETHHSHLVIPLTQDYHSCIKSTAKFMLSHGATFFCPHTYDVKLIAKFENNNYQTVMCEYFFNAIDDNTSLKFALRPTLVINGLPATGQGYSTSWTSPVLYQVHNFGNSSADGPGNGWNTTTLINANVTVLDFQVAYFREFEIGPPLPVLSYLIHAHEDGVTGSVRYILTHYITSAPNFDQILYVKVLTDSNYLRTNGWAMRLVIPNRKDTFDDKLTAGEQIQGLLYSTDANGNPIQYLLDLIIEQEIYSGIDDGFADFGYNCETAPPNPQSRGLCVD